MLEILHDEGPLLAVNKPNGLPTQAPPGIDSLEVRVKDFYRRREQKEGKIYLGVPHRLDRPASGVNVFARHVRAAHRISRQFEERSLKKVYWAGVAGVVSPSEGAWSDHLLKVYGKPRAEVVPADHLGAKLAALRYRTLGEFAWGTWLEIELETGRTHQVRVQAASRGHPVLGDEMYGSQVPFGPLMPDERLWAIALHARRLQLLHPMTKQPLDLIAPLPAAWNELGPGFVA